MPVRNKTKATIKKVEKKKENKPKYATLEEPKEEKVVEKKEIVEKTTVPKRLEVKIKVAARFSKTNLNEYAATFGYYETSNELGIIQGKDGAYGADVENIFISDILIIDPDTGAKSVISKTTHPKAWIQNLHKAALGKPYIASEAVSHYETE